MGLHKTCILEHRSIFKQNICDRPSIAHHLAVKLQINGFMNIKYLLK